MTVELLTYTMHNQGKVSLGILCIQHIVYYMQSSRSVNWVDDEEGSTYQQVNQVHSVQKDLDIMVDMIGGGANS